MRATEPWLRLNGGGWSLQRVSGHGSGFVRNVVPGGCVHARPRLANERRIFSSHAMVQTKERGTGMRLKVLAGAECKRSVQKLNLYDKVGGLDGF